MVMTVKIKKQSPSKLKYDAEHPVISFRLDLELKEKLEGYIEEKGISNADFIKEALDVREAKDAELIERTYDIGYEAGLEEGEERNEEITAALVEQKAICATLQYTNQSYAAQNRELQAKVASVQKSFTALDNNELNHLRDMALKAQLNKEMERTHRSIQEGLRRITGRL